MINFRHKEGKVIKMSTTKTKMVFVLFILPMFILSLTSCAASADNLPDGVSISGKTIMIELEENPSTGFSWSYSLSDEDVIHLVEDGYVADSDDPNVVGGGGMHEYKFEGLEAGETTIIFDYFKSWEGIESAEEHVEYVVTVEDDGSIAEVTQ